LVRRVIELKGIVRFNFFEKQNEIHETIIVHFFSIQLFFLLGAYTYIHTYCYYKTNYHQLSNLPQNLVTLSTIGRTKNEYRALFHSCFYSFTQSLLMHIRRAEKATYTISFTLTFAHSLSIT